MKRKKRNMKRKKKNKPKICYLCGESINPKDLDREHVPPKQMYPKGIRKANNPQLITLASHKQCNQKYQKDEEYFKFSLGCMAIAGLANVESEIRDPLLDDLKKIVERKEYGGLNQRVLKEFTNLVTPRGDIIKKFEGERIAKILWKIVRGLFFHETGERFLPDDTYRLLHVFSANPELDFFDKPTDFFTYLQNTPLKGVCPSVFGYKYKCLPSENDPHWWVWGLFFWENTIIVEINCLDPKSSKEECRQALKNAIDETSIPN